MTDGPSGFVTIGSRTNQNGQLGTASWQSADGSEFTLYDNDPQLSADKNEQRLGADITHDGDTVLAVGEWQHKVGDPLDTDGVSHRSSVAGCPGSPRLDRAGGGVERRTSGAGLARHGFLTQLIHCDDGYEGLKSHDMVDV
jgi:hypothetical protein